MLAFVVLLSIVIFVHEAGHFIVGRKMGIGVERFALGFGRAIVTKVHHGVEYRINWIPFGGYVKFVGEEPGKPIPEELRAVAFNTAPVHKRALTAVAGPAMNLVLAFVLFCVVYLVGQPTPTTLIGNVAPDGTAARAGLQPGDRIVAIAGEKVEFWQTLVDMIGKNPEKTLPFTIEREGKTFNTSVTIERVVDLNIFGFEAERGSIGIQQYGPKAWIGVRNFQSPAFLAGLRTGDLILAVNGRPVTYWTDLDRVLAAQGHAALKIAVARGNDEVVLPEPKIAFTADIPPPAPEQSPYSAQALGIENGSLYLYEVIDGTPAQRAGFQAGDRLLAINDEPITSWEQFSRTVREHPDQSLTVTVDRGGAQIVLAGTPELKSTRDLLGKVTSFGYFGLAPYILYSNMETKLERYFNPVKILVRGFQESWYWAVITLKGFFYLIVGKAPSSSLGGPIMIAQLAGESARLGWIPFVFFMAVISLNLAFINLFPIPVLDGGHLLLFSMEAIRRRPLAERTIGIAQRIGLAFIGALILLVFYNDLSRLWFDLKDRFFG